MEEKFKTPLWPPKLIQQISWGAILMEALNLTKTSPRSLITIVTKMAIYTSINAQSLQRQKTCINFGNFYVND